MSYVLSATGHRPGDRYDHSPATFKRLVDVTYDWFSTLDEEPEIVIVGMALGFDQAVATVALELGIPVHAYIPFRGQSDKWTQRANEQYSMLLQRCSKILVVSEGGYAPKKMQIRNEAMVDDSDCALALWDGTPGGTANFLDYAEMMERPILANLWDEFNR